MRLLGAGHAPINALIPPCCLFVVIVDKHSLLYELWLAKYEFQVTLCISRNQMSYT